MFTAGIEWRHPPEWLRAAQGGPEELQPKVRLALDLGRFFMEAVAVSRGALAIRAGVGLRFCEGRELGWKIEEEVAPLVAGDLSIASAFHRKTTIRLSRR
jgi:hypothetical protein